MCRECDLGPRGQRKASRGAVGAEARRGQGAEERPEDSPPVPLTVSRRPHHCSAVPRGGQGGVSEQAGRAAFPGHTGSTWTLASDRGLEQRPPPPRGLLQGRDSTGDGGGGGCRRPALRLLRPGQNCGSALTHTLAVERRLDNSEERVEGPRQPWGRVLVGPGASVRRGGGERDRGVGCGVWRGAG